ncbi:hypothetical protein BS47DRAFT_1349304 [Hydnum rufescens UP504]|uniref:DRBM domain-containing protein n=1 Tax=Hydnum rufescens UP504 TaxID=1448309 RepID=A0A9P6ANX9_9AGAM|nr:hypothetical protein BS47DRAFT_1349304 [Hydnum rufescens UP504]
MSSPSNPSITRAGHVRRLENLSQSSKWELEWKEEPVGESVSADGKPMDWEATVIVDGVPLGTGSGPKLKVAKDRAAREALIALRIIKPPPTCVRA